ncbi:MAG: hypothetical protein A3H98_11950 [Bacteroidetes bacterium RIFCSPLOWO2_02_FULL_36_8]|nr:MAG: hypothetical protein A3H98_11950 [Bacteroidetes bacterium RIFCSPLOWO2_02_FULL_36_8]OFY69572.1 MAG: hypothetical protein A3G23_11080 [Bacteroidetes bacterium RIFCSPLOWO2_12_FULL_37_12]
MRSFTLVEVLIVLVLCGIIVGTSGFLLIVFNRQFEKFQHKSNVLSELILLDRLLNEDFSTGYNIDISNDKKIQIMKQKDTVTYHFGKNFVVRNQNFSTDMFKIETINFSFGVVAEENKQKVIFQELIFTIAYNGIARNFKYIKKYDAFIALKPGKE